MKASELINDGPSTSAEPMQVELRTRIKQEILDTDENRPMSVKQEPNQEQTETLKSIPIKIKCEEAPITSNVVFGDDGLAHNSCSIIKTEEEPEYINKRDYLEIGSERSTEPTISNPASVSLSDIKREVLDTDDNCPMPVKQELDQVQTEALESVPMKTECGEAPTTSDIVVCDDLVQNKCDVMKTEDEPEYINKQDYLEIESERFTQPSIANPASVLLSGSSFCRNILTKDILPERETKERPLLLETKQSWPQPSTVKEKMQENTALILQSESTKASTTEIQGIRSVKNEYRERKKYEDVLEEFLRVPKNIAQISDGCRERDLLKEIKKPKTKVQRYKEYRKKQNPKTNAQRNKEYRERQKIKKQIELQQKNTDHLQRSTKTRAEYMREYRRKLKSKNQTIQLNDLIEKDQSDASIPLEDGEASSAVITSSRAKNKKDMQDHGDDVGRSKNAEERPFKCEVCDYRAKKQSHLRLHVMTHTGENPIKCKECDYQCKQNGALKKHMIIHTEAKPYKCEHCDYTSKDHRYLRRHLKKHTVSKPYKCKVCDYQCNQTGYLRRHMKSHTEEKPYKCDICDYQCKQLVNLKRHARTHTGEKPFECNICSYQCSCGSAMKVHLRTHTGEKPYKCKVCNHQCNSCSAMKVHMRMHTGEKPYKCKICDYQCTSGSALSKHMRTHSENKPYKCDLCNYQCSFISSMNRHLRTHTGEKLYKCQSCEFRCKDLRTLRKHKGKH